MPTDTYTELNCGAGGSIMDEIGVDYGDVTPLPDPCPPLAPGTTVLRRRAKVVISGADVSEVTTVSNTGLNGDEYGLSIRAIDRAYATSITSFDEATSVSPDDGSGTYTSVSVYTVPVSSTFVFQGVIVGGDIGAKFRIKTDSTTNFIVRTSNANQTNSLMFKSPPFEVGETGVITVEVIYYNDNSSIAADFEATILGYIF